MKIIGIEILGGCEVVIKNLKTDEKHRWYPFGNYQYPHYKDNLWVYEKDGTSHEDDIAMDQMYKSVCETDEYGISARNFAQFNLSFCSIVGPNGSGKSTLLELLFRIINNFSYAVLHSIEDQGNRNWLLGSNLSYAYGVDARLFFYEYGEPLRSVHCCYENVYWEEYTEYDAAVKRTEITKDTTIAELWGYFEKFFYTICTNYSNYSFIESDYVEGDMFTQENEENKKINGDWIRGLLHKNDGYLVPLVIAPYREEGGFVDPRKEEWLAKQRLSTLGVLYASQEQDLPGGYHASKIEYRFNPTMAKHYDRMLADILINRFPINDKRGDCKKWKEDLKRIWTSKFIETNYGKLGAVNSNVQNAVVTYLCYKTLKICLNYASYGRMMGIRDLNEEEKKDYGNDSYKRVTPSRTVDFVQIVDTLLDPAWDSHVNLKIRQCISFLNRGYYKVEYSQDQLLYEDKVINSHSVPIEDFLEDNYKIDDVNSYADYDKVYTIMPPPFFDYNVLFSQDDRGKKHIRLESMSSGERHLLNNLSYLLYHINNIQSVKSTIYTIPRQHINIVMDEAELYYHPEYQRQLIKHLVQMMAVCQVNVKQIKSINFVIVTHSPFVLSDIPHDRILFMKNGQSEPIDENQKTVAANIHDLLYNQFILRNTIGSVSETLIKKIAHLYQHRSGLSEEERTEINRLSETCEYMVSHIAEPYTAKTIRFMLNELGMNDSKDDIYELRRQYELLGKRIKEMERGKDAQD